MRNDGLIDGFVICECLSLEQFDMCLGRSHKVTAICSEKEDTVCQRKT